MTKEFPVFKQKLPLIESKIENGYFKIFINNTLHLQFRIEDYLGMQSWIYPYKATPYHIEFTLKSKATILCQYDNIDKWKKILELINKIDF